MNIQYASPMTPCTPGSNRRQRTVRWCRKYANRWRMRCAHAWRPQKEWGCEAVFPLGQGTVFPSKCSEVDQSWDGRWSTAKCGLAGNYGSRSTRLRKEQVVATRRDRADHRGRNMIAERGSGSRFAISGFHPRTAHLRYSMSDVVGTVLKMHEGRPNVADHQKAR